MKSTEEPVWKTESGEEMYLHDMSDLYLTEAGKLMENHRQTATDRAIQLQVALDMGNVDPGTYPTPEFFEYVAMRYDFWARAFSREIDRRKVSQ